MDVAVVGAGLSSCARWGPGTIHQPAAPGFWCGVYIQPFGMVIFPKLTKTQLLPAYQMTLGRPEVPEDWEEMNDKNARLFVARTFGFHL